MKTCFNKMITKVKIFIVILLIIVNQRAFSDDNTADPMIGTALDALSCELNSRLFQQIGSWTTLNSCVTSPAINRIMTEFMNLAGEGIPTNYLMVLRLKVNDNLLFPGNCSIANRPSLDQLKMNYGLCRNLRIWGLGGGRSMLSFLMDFFGDFVSGRTLYINGHDKFHNRGVFGSNNNSGIRTYFDLSLLFPYIVPFTHWVERGNLTSNFTAADQLCVRIQRYLPLPGVSVSSSANSQSAVRGLREQYMTNPENPNTPQSTDSDRIPGIPTSVAVNIGCVYIKEPCPISRFESRNPCPALRNLGLNTERDTQNLYMADSTSCPTVRNCVQDTKSSSLSVLPMTSVFVNCTRLMIDHILKGERACNMSASGATADNLSSDYTGQNKTREVQDKMVNFVKIFLTIYIVITGIGFIINPDSMTSKEFIGFIVKFVLVAYFSVGINTSLRGENRSDGITSILFPTIYAAIPEVATWMLNGAQHNGLCVYKREDYHGLMHLANRNMGPNDSGRLQINETQISFNRLWDALDCRLSFYLGIDALVDLATKIRNVSAEKNLDTQLQSSEFPDSVIDLMPESPHPPNKGGFSVPPYLIMLLPALLIGQPDFIMLMLSYPLMVISIVVFVMGSYVSSLIYVAVLGLLAPLFVPMSLFSKTQKYFEGWLTLLISLIVHPAMIIAFSAFIFSVYDKCFFNGCQFTESTMNTYGKTFKRFFISKNLADYPGRIEQFKTCTQSIGWAFNNVGNMLGGGNVEVVDMDVNSANRLSTDNRTEDDINKSAGVVRTEGMFGGGSIINWSYLANFFKSLLVALVALTVMQNMTDKIEGFASDLSGGGLPSMGPSVQSTNSMLKSGTARAHSSFQNWNKERKENKKMDNKISGKKSFSEARKERAAKRKEEKQSKSQPKTDQTDQKKGLKQKLKDKFISRKKKD